MVGKARTFSDSAREAVYQKEFDDEIYTSANQQNSYNLGSVHFSDQSGIANITQAGSDQRKASLEGALFRGNIGFELETAVLDVGTDTIDLLEDATSTAIPRSPVDRIVSISAGLTADLVTILGAQRPGQRLVLYNITGNTITVKNTAAATPDTILTPDTNDFTFSNNMVIEFAYDITTSKWRLFTGISGGSGSGGAGNVISQGDSNVTVTDPPGLITFTVNGNLITQIQDNRMDFQDTDIFGVTQLSFNDELDAVVGTILTQNQNDFTMNFPDNADIYNIDFNSVTGLSVDLLRTRFHSNSPNIISSAISLFRDDPSPGAADALGDINFDGRDSAANFTTYVDIIGAIESPTSTAERGRLSFRLQDSGVMQQVVRMTLDELELTDMSILLDEISLPSNPTANQGLMYLRDVAGTTTPFFLDSSGTETSMIGGGGVTNQISQLDSNVTVTDVGVGLITMDVDGTQRYSIQANRADYANIPIFGLTDLNFNDTVTDLMVVMGASDTQFFDIEMIDAGNGIRISFAGDDTAVFSSLNLQLLSATPNTLSAALRLFRDDPSPAVSDALGSIHFDGRDSGGGFTNYATLIGGIEVATAGSESGSLVLNLLDGGPTKQLLEMIPDIFGINTASIRMDEIALPSNPAANEGLIYLRDDAGTTTPFFLDSSGTETSMIGGGAAGANTALSNLIATSINQDLLPNSAGVFNLGSAALRWGNCFFGRIVFPTNTAPIAGDVNIVRNANDMQYNVPTGSTFNWTFQSGTTQMELSATELRLPGVNLDMENNNITDANQIQLTGSSGDTVRGFFSAASGFLDISEDENSGTIRMFAKTAGGASNNMVDIDGGTGLVTFGQGGIVFGASPNQPTIVRSGNDLQISTVAASSIILQSAATDRVNLTGTDFNVLTGTFVDWQESVSSATAGASTLPSNPTGFIKVKVSGTERRIPFYAI